MAKVIGKLLAGMQTSPRAVRFSDALKVAEHYFGKPRISGSHHVFRMPWPGDPRINLQSEGGKAKPYQVRQLLAAIEKRELLDAKAARSEGDG
ncbi:MAG: hypothetical protein ACREFJ_17695 [Acetobacteraceae bacterium]